jgi:hypothetical protein
VRQEFAKLSFRNGLTGSIPVSSANNFKDLYALYEMFKW